jgi:hypothetical protein
MEIWIAPITALAALLMAGVLVFVGFHLSGKATQLGRADLVNAISDMRKDAERDRKAARSDLRYVVNLIGAKDPMAMQQLEAISQISNPAPTTAPDPSATPVSDGSFSNPGDYEEALAEAQRLGVQLPGGSLL